MTMASPLPTAPRVPHAPRAARALALAGAWLALGSAAHALDLTVEVANTKADKGPVLGALYGSADGWLQFSKAVRSGMAPVSGGKAVMVLRDLPAGSYALSLYQDENGNGKLDTNLVGMPQERTGFSRDAQGNMGPPRFQDAAIELQQDTTITIQLR
jgi:uncharacterized protein (DUF2141 family)